MKKFISILGNVFTVLLLVFSITITVVVIASTRDEDRIPSVAGYALFNVETDSMVGENGFDPGDLIIIKKLSDEECDVLKPGDVITYRRVFNQMEFLDTHRIVEITEDIVEDNFGLSNMQWPEVKDGVWVHGGVKYYITQGDNTPNIDYKDDGSIQFASSGNIVGKWTGTKIPVLGSVLKFLKSQMGFMICVVLPIALFFVYQLYIFVVTLSAKKKEEALAEVSSKEEELKAKAVAEFLAQQQKEGAEKAQESTAPPAPAEEKAPEEEPKAEPAETPEISEEDKARIIAEYMAKQAEALHKKDAEEK